MTLTQAITKLINNLRFTGWAYNTIEVQTICNAVKNSVCLDWISGRFYDYSCSMPAPGSGNQTMPNGKLNYSPIFIPNDLTIKNLWFHNTVAYSGKLGRLGVYSNNGSKPDLLLWQSGDLSLTNSTMQSITCGLQVSRLVRIRTQQHCCRYGGSTALWQYN